MPAGRNRLIAAILLLGGFGLGTLVAFRGSGPDQPSAGSSLEPASDDASKVPLTGSATADSASASATVAIASDPTAGEVELGRNDVARIELGRATYDQHCASCHGLDGEGQADWKIPNADGSLPAPPHTISGHTWHHADAQLLDIIAQGGTIYMPESTMPGFAELLSQAEMEATLAYIKRWWGPKELDFQAEVSAGWPTAEAP